MNIRSGLVDAIQRDTRTINQLAKEAGVSVAWVYRLIGGDNVNLDRCEAIAREVRMTYRAQTEPERIAFEERRARTAKIAKHTR